MVRLYPCSEVRVPGRLQDLNIDLWMEFGATKRRHATDASSSGGPHLFHPSLGSIWQQSIWSNGLDCSEALGAMMILRCKTGLRAKRLGWTLLQKLYRIQVATSYAHCAVKKRCKIRRTRTPTTGLSASVRVRNSTLFDTLRSLRIQPTGFSFTRPKASPAPPPCRGRDLSSRSSTVSRVYISSASRTPAEE